MSPYLVLLGYFRFSEFLQNAEDEHAYFQLCKSVWKYINTVDSRYVDFAYLEVKIWSLF